MAGAAVAQVRRWQAERPVLDPGVSRAARRPSSPRRDPDVDPARAVAEVGAPRETSGRDRGRVGASGRPALRPALGLPSGLTRVWVFKTRD